MSLTLAASPRGARVGFCVAGSSNAQISLTVAPKAWRGPGAGRLTVVSQWPDRTHHNITLHETDRLHITADNRELEGILNGCLRQSRSSAGGGGDWGESLLTPDIAPQGRDGTDLTDSDANAGTTTDLLLLFDQLGLLHTNSDALAATPQRSPLHRPLLYRRLLDEVLNRLTSARRGYRQVTAVLSTVRGRVDAASVHRHLRTGEPRLVCRYDELTESTVLLGIICTALEWIAEGNSVRSPFGDRFATARLRDDAVALRRALGEVATIPIATALSAGARLHLNRLDQPWATALQISLAVLRECELVAGDSRDRSADPIELSIRTDKLWERIVHELLGRMDFDWVRDQRELDEHMVVDPWTDATRSDERARTYPDGVAATESGLWVIDAKYKLRDVATAPDRGDQYQLFAYSHLVAEQGRTVRRAVLVYPGSAPTKQWPRGRDSTVYLTACSVPFPSQRDVRSRSSWVDYLARTSRQLSERLHEGPAGSS